MATTTRLSSKQKRRIKQLSTALKSGTYRQGRGMLYDKADNTYCFLGVVADIYLKETKQGYWVKDASDDTSLYTSCAIQEGRAVTYYTVTLPNQVLDWYGFSKLDMINLIDMNDTTETDNTFTDIANHLTKAFSV